MMLWASAHLNDLAAETAVKDWQQALFTAQRDEGGWVLAELGNADWKRADSKSQSKEPDGYATAFAIHVLTESGVARDHPRLRKARTWLRSQQRESGRWFARSPHKDNKHFISHAATNFALLALAPEGE
jgi:squalene-hopene/tetraprenyl-beta-curcumene cyclase